MISCTIKVSPSDAKRVLVEVSGPLKNRKGLNAVLAQRLADEMVKHFREKNAKPNKRGWKKTNFWERIASATAVGKVTDDNAIVTVADQRYAIHLFGGDIKPTGGRENLSIPLVEDARDLNPSSYERRTGRELFRIGRALFEKRSRGGDRSLTAAATGRRRRNGVSTEVPLAARQQLRAVYALTPQVHIDEDPTAFPDLAELIGALNEEAGDFIEREAAKGGPR